MGGPFWVTHLLSEVLLNPDSSSNNLTEPNHGCPAVQVGDGDFFWESNGTLQFPEMAGNVDVQLKQYTDVR